MSNSDWNKVDFQQFISEFGYELIVNNAPTILYSKKDKEHEAYNSIIAFFFITGGLLIYISLSYIFDLIFNLVLIIVVSIIAIIIDIFLIINYVKSNVYIRPLECWVEIHKGKFQNDLNFYCFTYYPIFSGKCHPNEVKNVIFKFYQEEVLKGKIDITQIEVYLKINQNHREKMGYFFQYGEGRPFDDENIVRNSWKFFPSHLSKEDNFIATANWDHQFEWRNDLELDFDKLHRYAPWVIQRWDEMNLKPLTEEFKRKNSWHLRSITSEPKLNPWGGDIENQTYENPRANWDINIINEALENVIGKEKEVKKLKKVKGLLPMFKSYFRDLDA